MFAICIVALSAIAQPVIELPDEAPTSSTATAAAIVAPAPEEPGFVEKLARRTVIGSYGEAALEYLAVGPNAPLVGQATIRRITLSVAHTFSDELSGYIEAEWENAIACDGCRGSAEIEQAYVDYKLLGDDLALRGGLILVPMGIVNVWHEPPIYHGVARPRFDQIIIPSTWRELGFGATGRFLEIGRWELYAMLPLNALALQPSGFAGARTQGSFSPGNGYMFTGRAEVEPILGMIAGVSALFGDLGGGDRFYNSEGVRKSLFLPMIGASADARIRRSGFEAKVVAASFFFPETSALLRSYRADGSPHFADPMTTGAPAERIWGAYGELAYDVFYLFFDAQLDQQLLPFARVEFYDTQAAMPDELPADPLQQVVETTFGLTYRPFRQVVIKADYQLRDRKLGLDEKQLNFGMGYMF